MLIETPYNYLCTKDKLSEQYEHIKKCLNRADERWVMQISMKFAEPLPENVWSFPSKPRSAINIFTGFVNKYIVLELPNISYKTLKVRLRIAASLLNKVDSNRTYWTHDKKVQIFNNLCKNIEKEQMALYAEDLPF